jgi:hypothetical protein
VVLYSYTRDDNEGASDMQTTASGFTPEQEGSLDRAMAQLMTAVSRKCQQLLNEGMDPETAARTATETMLPDFARRWPTVAAAMLQRVGAAAS